jgi:predicted nucleic acid-binding Zn ribbon protein
MAENLHYIVCRTCGRYITTTQPVKSGFCSEDCAQKYSCCITCGRFVPLDRVYEEHYCSRDCSLQYELKELPRSRSVRTQIKEKVS